MSFLSGLFRRRAADPPPTPQLDEGVARRLAAEGKDPATVTSRAAAPQEVPPRPEPPGFQGTVRFTMTVDDQGGVKAVEMAGAPFEHVSVLEAWAYGWRFAPALLDGKPHPCRMVYEVTWS